MSLTLTWIMRRAHLTIQTRGIVMAQGRVVGQAYTPHDWLTRLNGLAAVNGGYFGQEDGQGRKEFVGLLVQKGRVRHAAPPLFGQGSATIRRGQYVRSAFGLTAEGQPVLSGRRPNLVSRSLCKPTSGRWESAGSPGTSPALSAAGRR